MVDENNNDQLDFDEVETVLLNTTNSTNTLENGSLISQKYRIVRQIGRGGMSTVYLAVDQTTGKYWAIKALRNDKDPQSNNVAHKAMYDEAYLMSKLQHPALPCVVDIINENEGKLYVVMDYIEGVTLSEIMKSQGAQSQEKVVGWVKQLASVLQYLHSQKPPIIYRDMKPSNIILKKDGKLCLIDLGISREYKQESLEDTICVGTVGYAAPEQFGGQAQSDQRTDIYALGVTMHYLLTGKNPVEPPFDLKPIRKFKKGLSKDLEVIVSKCTEFDPQNRYVSCDQVIAALNNLGKSKKTLGLLTIPAIGCGGVLSSVLALLIVIALIFGLNRCSSEKAYLSDNSIRIEGNMIYDALSKQNSSTTSSSGITQSEDLPHNSSNNTTTSQDSAVSSLTNSENTSDEKIPTTINLPVTLNFYDQINEKSQTATTYVSTGDIVELIIRCKSDRDIIVIEGLISYDSTMLEILNFSDADYIYNVGNIRFVDDDFSSDSNSASYRVVFKAISSGTININCEVKGDVIESNSSSAESNSSSAESNDNYGNQGPMVPIN